MSQSSKEHKKAYYIRTKDRDSGKRKKWREDHVEWQNNYNHEYYKKNREKILVQVKSYVSENQEKVSEYQKSYHNKRMESDPVYRAFKAIRSRISAALKYKGQVKVETATKLVGGSINQLKFHLESQFREGMSWDNYGSVWHVDHKRPCGTFDLGNPEEMKDCFHYLNLQPLFKMENWKKGKNILLEFILG